MRAFFTFRAETRIVLSDRAFRKTSFEWQPPGSWMHRPRAGLEIGRAGTWALQISHESQRSKACHRAVT
jgi:hypothetical protein